MLSLWSCEEKEREPEIVLMKALEALNHYMKEALRQHLGWRRSERAAVMSIDILEKVMEEDSVCTVYYQYTFADDTKEAGSQKMVRHGETWKLRLRN